MLTNIDALETNHFACAHNEHLFIIPMIKALIINYIYYGYLLDKI